MKKNARNDGKAGEEIGTKLQSEGLAGEIKHQRYPAKEKGQI